MRLISSAIALSDWFTTLTTTGSTLIGALKVQVPEVVQPAGPSRRNPYRRGVLLDDRRTLEPLAKAHQVALDEADTASDPVDVDLDLITRGFIGRFEGRIGRSLWDHGRHADRDDLGPLVLGRMPVPVTVHRVEAGRENLGSGDRLVVQFDLELKCLARITQVGTPTELQVRISMPASRSSARA